MNMNTISPLWIVAVILILVVLGIAAWAFSHRKRQSQRLRHRFGPEYDRAVADLGGRTKAETNLMAREARVQRLNITLLAPSEAARFRNAWNDLQGRFVDNPREAVGQADLLVRELMLKRGYPVGDFESRAADISVDHPIVVENFRAAQAIAVRNERQQSDTEELRRAVVHYRALFDELLDASPTEEQTRPTKRIPVHS
jgi:hypothetical protein